MSMKYTWAILLLIASWNVQAQTAITSTDTLAAKVMMGQYDPAFFWASTPISHPDSISRGMMTRISPDSLRAYLEDLKSFTNRNTGSDTLSPKRGIGAARRWVYGKFRQFSTRCENRLLPSYLQFDQTICSIGQHRNVFAVLPGSDTTDKSIVIIEAHLDSRCEDLCDTACQAQGMEDNASGTALMLELARVMSRYTYQHTLVFIATIAEEQGLNGATAFANYASLHGIKVKAVLNNDVIGGVFCGHTSSPPSCPGFKNIDSTNVRLFSYAGFNSPHKGLCRYIKLEYKEMVRPYATVPMTLNLMTPEDRTGRGGDHIPFRSKGFTAMRFTAQNENGDASLGTSYADRQHTSDDSLGLDINGDGILDSFFVDFNYLARNAVINGNAAGMAAISPQTPSFTVATTGGNLIVNITDHPEYLHYRIGLRTTTYDWDTVYTFVGALTETLTVAAGTYIVSVASVDDKGVESLFSGEVSKVVPPPNGLYGTPTHIPQNIELLQNKPNPADEATMITVQVTENTAYKEAYISIADLNGKEVARMPLTLQPGINEVLYEHGYNAAGTYLYSLIIDGKTLATKRMQFNN